MATKETMLNLAETMAVAMAGDKDAESLIEARAELVAALDGVCQDADRLWRLAEMEASLCSENRVCYYLRNMNELDRLIKLDKLAKEAA
jgi:hypothetical protein